MKTLKWIWNRLNRMH